MCNFVGRYQCKIILFSYFLALWLIWEGKVFVGVVSRKHILLLDMPLLDSSIFLMLYYFYITSLSEGVLRGIPGCTLHPGI